MLALCLALMVPMTALAAQPLETPGSVAILLGETTGLPVQTTSPALGAANV